MFARRLGLGLRPRGPVAWAACAKRLITAPTVGARPFNAGDTDGPQPMSMFGDERILLAKEVMAVMKEMPSKPRFFLDNGTLLGLWRNGELIDSDDDFDFGLLVDGAEFSANWVKSFQRDFQARLEQRLKDTGSGMEICSRVVDTYAHKIEIYDPTLGSFPLDGAKYEGARYHHVSVDLQLHVEESKREEKSGEGQGANRRGVTIQHTDFETRGQAPGRAYEPFGSISFAEADWPVPGRQEDFLSYLYGFLGTGAEFDEHSRLYRKEVEHPEPTTGDRVAYETNASSTGDRKPVRLYTDMCADLFHTGHVNYLRQCQGVAENVHLIVGIHSDETIESYKRASVCTMDERVGVVEACSFVDTVLSNAPLRVTAEFMDQHDIDFVVHGTETPEAERQAMYEIPIGRGRYLEVPRTPGISTTQLINRIAGRLAVDYEKNAIPSNRRPELVVRTRRNPTPRLSVQRSCFSVQH